MGEWQQVLGKSVELFELLELVEAEEEFSLIAEIASETGELRADLDKKRFELLL